MPGNDVGDRVHNFFAQDSLSQEQHHSPVVDGAWQAHSNNLWVGSQRQIGVLTSNTKNYNFQSSDGEKGPSSYPLSSQHGLNFMQSTPRPEFANNQSQNHQANLNGYMYGSQFYQTREGGAKFPAVDTGNLASGGLSPYASQQGVGSDQLARVAVRSEPLESPVSFDLFGGQQMSHQQSNMLQSLQRQQSGFSDMQQAQQQVMLKMQELQRQQQLQQVDFRQQNTLNQGSTLSKGASGSHPPASVSDTTSSGALNYPWSSDVGSTNWLQHGSPILHGCSNGLNPTNIGQAQQFMGLSPMSAGQSLYGVPVSGSRGSANSFSPVMINKPTAQPVPTFDSSLHVNQYAALQDQVSGQDGTFIPRQRSQAELYSGHSPSQTLSNAINTENPQQENGLQKSSDFHDFRGVVSPENLHEKPGAPASFSQDEVGLDPTEERILFGSEDNIFASFGKDSSINGDGGHPFDGSGLMNDFSSIQSGTWSALMHSAVAETSSNDVCVQEDWGRLNFQSTEIPAGTQNLTHHSGRHKTSAEEHFPPNSSLNSVSVRPSDITSMNTSYSGVQGHRLPHDPGQSRHANSSQRVVQSPEEGSKWSNFGPRQKSVREVSQLMYGNPSHNIDKEINVSKISSPLTPELGGARQQSAGWSDVGSAVPSGDAALRVSSEKSSNHSHNDNQKKFIQAEVVHGGVTWNSMSGHNSAVGMEQHQVNSEVSNLQNSASIPNSSTMRGYEETSLLQNNYHSAYWKHTDALMKSAVSEGSGVLQHHVTKDNQVSHSSRSISDTEVKVSETENRDKNSNDSYRSNLFPHSSAARTRENISSDASYSRSIFTGKQTSSNQVDQKNTWPRKFQYHPMGNVDEDLGPPYDMKQPSHSRSILQQNANHGRSVVFGQVPKRQPELEEGQPSDVLRDSKGFGEAHLHNHFHSGGSSIPNRPDLHSANKAAQASPNMLQLLQKVDQSSVRGSIAQLSNSEQRESSEMLEAENSDGSVGHLQQSHSSTSQGFGLQLGPPSQRVSVQNRYLSSKSIQAVSSSHIHTSDEMGEKSHGQMHPPHHGQSLPLPEHSLEELKNIRSGVPGSTYDETSLCTVPGNFSSASDSGFPHSSGPLENPSVFRAAGQLSSNQSRNVSSDNYGPSSAEKDDCRRRPGSSQSMQASVPEGVCDVKQDKPTISAGKSQLGNVNDPHGRLSTNQVSYKEPGSVSQPFSISAIAQQGASSKLFTNMWSNFPPRQLLFGVQSNKESSHIIPQSQHFSVTESLLSAPERLGNKDALGASAVNILGSVDGEKERVMENTGRQAPFQNIEPIPMSDSQDREPSASNLSGDSASMQKDIEAFGRSLKPNNFAHQNFSLLNQMQAMKNVETDPSDRDLKRMRLSGSGTGGVKQILNFSGQEILQQSISSQQGGKMIPGDVLVSREDDSQSSSLSDNTNRFKSEHIQISPQMAPSWFNQYGAFKNAQMLQMYEANRAASMNMIDQPFTLGKSPSGLQALDNNVPIVLPVNAERSPVVDFGPSAAASSAAIEDLSSSLNAGQQQQLLKPKKRKRITSGLTPWYKQVSLDSRNNQTISVVETEWAKSTNRLIEKVEGDIDLNEHGPLGRKVKRRLILTTQLMQQLLRPPSAVILSSDAYSEYESVAYSVSRLALGDASSMVSFSSGDSYTPHACKESFHDKHKMSERNDSRPAKVMEELTIRARRLESEFLRLDKRASLLDLIMEGQDLEKFSVIYRFAKFHGRVQSEGVDISSSSDTRTHRPSPQRYVAALPMPKTLPSMVQCLSL